VTDTAASPFSPAPPDPEIAAEALVGDLRINYHDVGDGSPLLLLHGSGPGVSAWANWRPVIPGLAQAGHRVVAPDIPGFGYSDPLPSFSIDRWLDAISGLLDYLGLDKVSIVGNSFGGALALHLAARLPDRVDRAVVMGSAGVSFQLTKGLEKVWAYEPSGEAMLELLRIFAYNSRFATRELAELRFKASARPGAQEAYSALFPEPRQRWIDAMALSPQQLAAIDKPFLLIHGHDDLVVPLETTMTLVANLPNSQAHIFGQCGHWVQIEKATEFVDLLVHWFAV
jgi:2-hydroxymuconate-semialdehyde hydrolase